MLLVAAGNDASESRKEMPLKSKYRHAKKKKKYLEELMGNELDDSEQFVAPSTNLYQTIS